MRTSFPLHVENSVETVDKCPVFGHSDFHIDRIRQMATPCITIFEPNFIQNGRILQLLYGSVLKSRADSSATARSMESLEFPQSAPLPELR